MIKGLLYGSPFPMPTLAFGQNPVVQDDPGFRSETRFDNHADMHDPGITISNTAPRRSSMQRFSLCCAEVDPRPESYSKGL